VHLNSGLAFAFIDPRRKRLAAVIVGMAVTLVLSACTYETPDEMPGGTDSAAGSSPPATQPAEPPSFAPARDAWGPDARYHTIGGAPYTGDSRWPSRVLIASFTVAETGVVYVDADTSKIVWENWEHNKKEIGQQPWQGPGATGAGRTWGDFRDLVGNPSHDVVSWVETTDAHRGDIVVVQPSTGEVLARAPLQASPERTVVLASVDGDALYWATVQNGVGGSASEDVWVWRWAAGEDPHPSQRGTAVLDVSGDIWAMEAEGRIDFQSADGSVLSSVHASYGDRTNFGGALSPGGRFWFAPAYRLVVETETGKEIPLERGFEGYYGWTGAEELTMMGPGLSVCSAITGECEDPINASYISSKYGLPLN
jgi:hypothetical protein